MSSVTPFPSGQAERDYIVSKASQLGLDPAAVLAVAAHEGGTLPAQVGDAGTSFGPWQLHWGGRLPNQVFNRGEDYAQRWSNSPAGVDYALEGIAGVARGLKGQAAVSAIVYQFEQPKNPAAETQAALQTYQARGGPGLYGPGGGPTISHGSQIPGVGAVSSAVGGAAHAVAAPFESITDFFNFVTSWRFVEVLGGFLLLLIGIYLLGRQFGVNVPIVPAPARSGAEGISAEGQAILQEPAGVEYTPRAERPKAKAEPVSSKPTPVYSTRSTSTSTKPKRLGSEAGPFAGLETQ